MDKVEMSEIEKRESAKNFFETTTDNELFAEQRSSELADEFTRLEVQIAAILIAFAVGFFDQIISIAEAVSGEVIFLIKFVYACSIFFLILSLVLGLIHIKRKEQFWNEMMSIRLITMRQWMRTLNKEMGASFEESLAFQQGTALDKGHMVSSPRWTWVLQTVFLGIAGFLFAVLFLVFLIAV